MNYSKLVAALVLFTFLFASCKKDTIDTPVIGSFFTREATAQKLTLYVNDELVGELPVISEGIASCNQADSAIKKTLNAGENSIEIMDEQGNIFSEVNVELNKRGD